MQNLCILIRKTYAFWKAKPMLFFRRSRQGLPDAAGQLAGCTGLVMVKHEQARPVLIAEMLFAAGDDR